MTGEIVAEPGAEPDVVLQLGGLRCGYGSAAVVDSLDLTVRSGEIVAVLGRNGVGKTTTMLTIAGLLPALGGSILLDGDDVTSASAGVRARRGLAMVPDGRGLFASLSVREHLRLARSAAGVKDDPSFQWFPQLAALANRRAALLSGGEQQQLAIACALVRRPKVLLVDELSLGLAPIIVAELLPLVRRLASEVGCGVVVVEQYVDQVLAVADFGIVLGHGGVKMSGTASDLLASRQALVSAYLG